MSDSSSCLFYRPPLPISLNAWRDGIRSSKKSSYVCETYCGLLCTQGWVGIFVILLPFLHHPVACFVTKPLLSGVCWLDKQARLLPKTHTTQWDFVLGWDSICLSVLSLCWWIWGFIPKHNPRRSYHIYAGWYILNLTTFWWPFTK